MSAFEIVRDARGSQIHVRRKGDGECVGCIEVGLYEIVRSVIEEMAAARRSQRAFQPMRAPAEGEDT